MRRIGGSMDQLEAAAVALHSGPLSPALVAQARWSGLGNGGMPPAAPALPLPCVGVDVTASTLHLPVLAIAPHNF